MSSRWVYGFRPLEHLVRGAGLHYPAVTPSSSCKSVSRSSTCAWIDTSSAETGSSQTITSGSGASARAMAVAGDPANAQALFSAQGTLVGVTEVDIRTGAHTVKFGAVRPGFTAVRVEVTVAGPESAERYAELAAAVDEHCPVLDLFRSPVPVTRAIAAETVTAAPA